MNAQHTQGFLWKNGTGAEAGDASTCSQAASQDHRSIKKPSSLIHVLRQVSVSTSLTEQDLVFLPTQSPVKPRDGSSP